MESSAEIFTMNQWKPVVAMRSSFNLHDSRVDFQTNQPSMPFLMSPCMPNHPIPKESSRDFNPQWYNTYPWISYNMEQHHFVCFACQEFMADNMLIFDDWKRVTD